MSSLFKAIQSECSAHLAAQEFFSDSEASTPKPITILTEQLRDIESQIDLAVGKIGLCCLVITPGAVEASENSKLTWDRIGITVVTYEQPHLNDRGIGAATVAESIAWHLHHFKLTVASVLVHTGIELVPDEEYLIYNTNFTTRGGINAAPTRT